MATVPTHPSWCATERCDVGRVTGAWHRSLPRLVHRDAWTGSRMVLIAVSSNGGPTLVDLFVGANGEVLQVMLTRGQLAQLRAVAGELYDDTRGAP